MSNRDIEAARLLKLVAIWCASAICGAAIVLADDAQGPGELALLATVSVVAGGLVGHMGGRWIR